jgi:hypothetical protein
VGIPSWQGEVEGSLSVLFSGHVHFYPGEQNELLEHVAKFGSKITLNFVSVEGSEHGTSYQMELAPIFGS